MTIDEIDSRLVPDRRIVPESSYFMVTAPCLATAVACAPGPLFMSALNSTA